MSKPRLFIAVHESVFSDPVKLTTFVTLAVRGLRGFVSKAQIDESTDSTYQAYHTTPESLAAATEPVATTGNYFVENIDLDEAGMVDQIQQLAELTMTSVKQTDIVGVEMDVAPDADKMLANVFGIVPVPAEPTEGE